MASISNQSSDDKVRGNIPLFFSFKETIQSKVDNKGFIKKMELEVETVLNGKFKTTIYDRTPQGDSNEELVVVYLEHEKTLADTDTKHRIISALRDVQVLSSSKIETKSPS